MKPVLRLTGRYLASIPVSIAFAGIVIVAAWVTGTLGGASKTTIRWWAASVETTIDSGHWWSVVTAIVIPAGAVQLAIVVIASLSVLGWAERLLGHGRTAALLVGTGIAGVGIGVLGQWGGSLIGEWWSADTQYDPTLDPLIPIVGTVLAASAFSGPLWKRRVRIGSFAILLVLALYGGNSADVHRLIAAAVGLAIGILLQRRTVHLRLHRSSHTETRTLTALVVAISAIGPAVSLISPDGYGVLSLVGFIFGDPFPTAQAVKDACASESALACAHDQAFLALRGPGSILMLFVPLVVMLVAAYGLRRGRRFAWGLAIIMNLTLAVMAFFLLARSVDITDENLSPIDAIQALLWVGGPILIPLGVAVGLVIVRRFFQLRSRAGTIIRFWVVSVCTLIALSAAYIAVAAATIGSFHPAVGLGQVFADAPLRFLPVSFLLSHDSVYFPGVPLTRVVFHWVGPIFWGVAIVGLLRILRSSASLQPRSGDEEIRRLIQRGTGTMGFMATWVGNRYWFSADGESAFAFRLVGDVAITLSDPLCPAGGERRTTLEFIEHCDRNGWVAAFYSVHESQLPLFRELGWSSIPVGVETLLNPRTLEFTGKIWQNVRTPLNRALKEGVRAEWTGYRELSRGLALQIHEISEQWVAEKDLPEMGFTLGGLYELTDPEVRLMLAIGPDERIQAVTSWLPVYRDGVPIGWTLDFMRRAEVSMPGIMEFVIASAALRMKEDGIEVLSLSGAPLATAPPVDGEVPPPPTTMSRLLDLLARMLEPVYGFSSLFRYKAKFHPRYETLHMAYRDPLTLPAIGRALAGAYLPDLSTAQTITLVRSLVG
jgi:phosphatidylglycerol lysyltransferase